MNRRKEVKNFKYMELVNYDVGDNFRSLEEQNKNSEEWKACKVCKAKPRLWEFNNGKFAACKCFKKWSLNSEYVRAESIMSYHKRNNGKNMGEYLKNDKLKENWNHFVETSEIIQLPKGQW